MTRASLIAFSRRGSFAAAVAIAMVAALLVAPAPSDSNEVGAGDTVPDAQIETAALTGEASKFLPLVPIRVLDTRSDPSYSRVFRNSSISLDPVTDTGVAEAAGVDASEITAVVVNSAVIKAAGAGFATMWPTGSTRPTTATNNTEFAGHIIGNLVIAPLGLERKISFYASTDADVTVDVLGVFVRSDESDAGRFQALGPIRHTDSRTDAGGPLAAGETRTFDLTTAGVPADATGVSMNITAFQSNGRGFYTVWASGTAQPNTANINVLDVGYAAGNQVVSGLTDGKIDIFSDVGGQFTVDITGYFTGASGETSTDGLFVPMTPDRFLDTRQNNSTIGLNGGNKLAAGERFALTLSGRGDLPAVGVKSVALNITGVQAGNRGFVKAMANLATEPETSSLNFTQPGQTVPNHAITSINETTGAIDLLPDVDVHAIVDATGYFLNENGVAPPAGGALKAVDPGTFVPTPLAAAPAVGPYDYLFDRSFYAQSGVRPQPTINTRYSACAPLRYALNVDLANDAEIADLIASIEEVEVYTGIDFQYAGVTSSGMNISDEILLPEAFDPPLPFQFLPPGADVVIGYTNDKDTPENAGGVIGVGGGLRIPSTETLFRGFATIDLPDLDNSAERKATTTHELGHMMGLGHVSDFDPRFAGRPPSTDFQGLDPNSGTWGNVDIQSQLMYPSLNPANTAYSVGDIYGLWNLYGTQTCAAEGLSDDTNSSSPIDWSTVEVIAEN